MPKRHAKHRRIKPPPKRSGTQAAAETGAGRERGEHKRIRLSSGLVGLSSVAVLTMYGFGYARTNHGDSNLAALGSEALSPAPATTASVQPAQLSPSATPVQSATGYTDGTYTGQGNSRHGGIQATVIIQEGKIVSASVGSCGTRYPCSYVDPLINEVLTTQAAPTHHVSGATDSSRAYRDAVAAALAKAKE